MYQLTSLEDSIKKLYQKLSIYEPNDICMYRISKQLDIWVHYHSDESKATKFNGKYYILLNNQLSKQEEWQDFGHELGHVIKHVGNQHKMNLPFRRLQENQSNNFMYQFCVPTFMLLKYDINNFTNTNNGIEFISETFNVTKPFAKVRLQHYKNQWMLALSDAKHRKYMESMFKKAKPYMPETVETLKRLDMILKKRKERENA